MPQSDYSSNYLLYNAEKTKNLVVVVEIEGVSTLLTSAPLYKRVRYGDPGRVYGESGLVYGGLIPYADHLSIVDLSGGSLTISQRLEPEQGRGAISTISISFIDLNQYMTRLISPGVIVDDILGKKITISLGYQEISYPEDFIVIFRGRVSAYESMSGRVTLQFSDPNIARRKQIFYTPTTKLAANINANATTIPVVSNTDFFKQILGPDGTYDSSITTYLTIEDEVIEYPATGFGTNQFTGCIREARGTTKVHHDAGVDVSCSVQIQGSPIDLALKFMLSGWNGPYLESLPVLNFYTSPDPSVTSQAGLLVLPLNTDANRKYGIVPGDYLTITGASVPGNNTTCRVLELVDLGDLPNNAIITDASFSIETASSAVFSVRSQYDTFPVSCGVKLPSTEVDILRHQEIKATFLSSNQNDMRFYITDTESSCKTFIESQIYLPLGCYSLTRFGRLSMNLTHAPIADDRLQFLTGDNVLNPQNIRPNRGVNNRKFFNEVDWVYDFYDDNQTAATTIKTIDTNSLNVIGILSVLPITGKGLRSDLGNGPQITRRTNFLLSRYKNGAVLINLEVNWETGCLIEAGDVVAIKDDGVLQISNFVTGDRNLGTQLFEVINRDLDVKSGNVKLQVVSGLGSQVTDRYATISPSSVIQTGSTVNTLKISDSYGAKYPGQEYRKWQDYIGIDLLVHSLDYSTAASCVLTGLGAFDPNTLTVSGLSLPASSLPGLVIDVANYSAATSSMDNEEIKAIHAFFSPTIQISTGVSASAFTVAPSAISRFQVGFPIVIHTQDYSNASQELRITNVDAGTYTVTASSSFGFVPSSAYYASYLGFPDGSATYRYI